MIGVERLLWRGAAASFLLSAVLGLYAGGCATGAIPADFHAALAAHLNALLGTFVLGAVAMSLPHVRYGQAGKRKLAWAFLVPVFANTVLTAIKAALHVRGLAMSGEPVNDVIAALLLALVVAPTFGAAVAWVAGLR